MSEVIKTGGVGKNPAIDKMNQLANIQNALISAEILREIALIKHSQRGREEIRKRQEIVKEFQICFKKEWDERKTECYYLKQEQKDVYKKR